MPEFAGDVTLLRVVSQGEAAHRPPLLDTALLWPLSLTFAPWRSYASERASAFLRGISWGRGGPRCSSKSKSWNSILLTLRRSTVPACSTWDRIFSRAL